MSDALLTVIIPTWNQASLLDRCLGSLRRQSATHRVLVVDNGSDDETATMLQTRFPEVEVIQLRHNIGFAAAVNQGIRRAATPFIALLNNDTEADPEWCSAGIEAFSSHPEFWILASRMIQFHRRDRLDSAGDCYSRAGLPTKRGNSEPIGLFQEEEPVLGASAGAAFYRRELFDRIGLFDESFYIYLEDVELSLRAQLSGFPCLYVPQAIVHHIEAASDPERTSGSQGKVFYSDQRVYWITRNRWSLMLLYQPLRNTPWLFFGWLKSFLFHLLKAGHSAAFLRGLLAGMAQSRATLRKRRQVWARRVISTEHLCRLFQKC